MERAKGIMMCITIMITITESTLRTPDGSVADCWEDRASGLLSWDAGLALIPYLQADQRADADDAYRRHIATYAAAAPPRRTPSRYRYFVDGAVALPSRQVNRSQDALIFDDGVLTGRIYLTTLAETQRMLEGR